LRASKEGLKEEVKKLGHQVNSVKRQLVDSEALVVQWKQDSVNQGDALKKAEAALAAAQVAQAAAEKKVEAAEAAQAAAEKKVEAAEAAQAAAEKKAEVAMCGGGEEARKVMFLGCCMLCIYPS
jgi:chromosome segregation ATPase